MGMSLGPGGSGRRPTPTMNVTPLVDVALVILIIFMMVLPMASKSFWLNLPRKDEDRAEPEPPPEAQKPLVLTVDREGAIRVNQTVLSRAELSERLPRMLAAQRQKVVYFDAHDDAPYGVAVEVMDLARQGGARSIAMLTQKVVK